MKEIIKITIGKYEHVVLEMPLWAFFIMWIILETLCDAIVNHFITRYL